MLLRLLGTAMSNEPASGARDAVDRIIFGVCEALALMLILPFGDALYRGADPSRAQWMYLSIGLLLAAAGTMPFWVREAWRRLRKSSKERHRRAVDDLRDWKSAPEAVEAFADPELVQARDKWRESIEDSYTKGKEAEEQIATISKQFVNGRPPEGSAERRALEFAERKMRGHAMIHDHAKDELRRTWDDLRADMHAKLRSGALLAKGFREPHVAGNPEVEIPSAEWRVLILNNVDSEALGQNRERRVYTGLVIAQARPVRP